VFPGHADTDSDHDVYGQRMDPSAESLNGGRTSAPNLGDFGATQYVSGREPYPAWGAERVIPLSKEEIEDIFLDLQQKFGFQRDSMRNMVWFSGLLINCAYFVLTIHYISAGEVSCVTVFMHIFNNIFRMYTRIYIHL